MKTEELAQFKEMLLRKRELLSGNLDILEEQALKKSRQESAGDLSTMPIHMADIGSDNFEQEFTLGLIESEEEMVKAMDGALERIENGTFGVCTTCEKPIRKARLKAIPRASLCIDCQREEERNG